MTVSIRSTKKVFFFIYLDEKQSIVFTGHFIEDISKKNAETST